MNYRFEHKATWHQAIISNDNEEMRDAVKGVEFRCFERPGKIRGSFAVLNGVRGETTTLSLQTNDKIAEQIKANDYVEYQGYRYQVASVLAMRSAAFRGAKEYILELN